MKLIWSKDGKRAIRLESVVEFHIKVISVEKESKIRHMVYALT